MSIPLERMVAVTLGLAVAPFAANELEQRRATSTPKGWGTQSVERLEPLEGAWRVLDSRWRILRGTEWAADGPADQLYVRTKLPPTATLALSLNSTGSDGIWFTFTSDGPVTATQSGERLACMGSAPPPPKTEAVELQRSADGVLLRWGDSTMVCLEPAPPTGGVPRLRTAGADIEVQSIGRDRTTDGAPLAPIWWMAFVVAWMLPWIVVFDFVRGLVRPKRSAPLPSEE